MKRWEFITSTGCLAILFAWAEPSELSGNRIGMAAAQIPDESKETRGTSKTATEQKEEYQKQIENKLAEFGDRLKALKAKGDKAGGKAKAELRDAAKKLERKTVVAKQQFEKFKSASEEAWEGAKSKMNAVMKDLERSFERATARLKKSTQPAQG